MLAMLSAITLVKADELKPNQIPSDEGLFPFVISYKMAAGVTDFSSYVDAPAGKYGFTRIEGKHFYNDKGRVVFNGVNIVGGACFPSHEMAERLAERLAHFGINMARLHFYDLSTYSFRMIKEKGLLVDDGTDCTLDPVQLDLFEYLIYQLKLHGIYLDVNFLVGRPFKTKNALDPKILQKELDFEKVLLSHVNPYTGLTLASDPAVALFELNNEDAVFGSYHYGWLKEEGMVDLKSFWASSEAEKLSTLEALEALDRNHWVKQRDFLIKELGVKVPVTSTQVSYSTPWAVMDMDWFDMHRYWCHPEHSGDKDRWTINNIAMINDRKGGHLGSLACFRPSDRPYTISECNFPFPIMYGAEGQPMLHAFAAFQGWDAIIAHSYNNLSNEEIDYLPYNFTYCARTDAFAHFIACSSMLLRGDVRESDTEVVIPFTRKQFEKGWCEKKENGVHTLFEKYATDGKYTSAHFLLHKTSVDFNATEGRSFEEEPLMDVKISDTKEIEWNNAIADKGIFVVRTKNTKLFSGFPAGRIIDLGDGISFELGATKLGWSTVSLVSQKANGFARKSSALLVATGYTKHTDQKFTQVLDENGNPTTKIHSRNEDWGHGPMLTEGINGRITLSSKASRTSCWALDEEGARKIEVPVSRGSDGVAVIEISDKYKTVWYEIETR